MKPAVSFKLHLVVRDTLTYLPAAAHVCYAVLCLVARVAVA